MGFKVNYKATRSMERLKAQVGKRYNQGERIDHHETFSAVAKMVTVRSLIALASIKELTSISNGCIMPGRFRQKKSI